MKTTKTKAHPVYNKAAASRILGLLYRQVEQVRIFSNAIWVYTPGYRPTFMKKELFFEDFVQLRADGFKSLSVDNSEDGIFVVRNSWKETFYEVRETPQGLECDCKDWKYQRQTLSEWPVCKHAIATHLFIEESRSAKPRKQRATSIVSDRFDVEYNTEQAIHEEAEVDQQQEWDEDCWQLDQLVSKWGTAAIAAKLKIIATGEGERFTYSHESAAVLQYQHESGYSDCDAVFYREAS